MEFGLTACYGSLTHLLIMTPVNSVKEPEPTRANAPIMSVTEICSQETEVC